MTEGDVKRGIRHIAEKEQHGEQALQVLQILSQVEVPEEGFPFFLLSEFLEVVDPRRTILMACLAPLKARKLVRHLFYFGKPSPSFTLIP